MLLIQTKKSFGNYSAITNNQGIVTISLPFNQTGTYTIQIIFTGYGTLAGINSQTIGLKPTVVVIDYVILFIEYLPDILIILAIIVAVGLLVNRTIIVPRRLR